MAAILKTFAGLNFYTRTCFIDYYHISFKKSHQTLRPRSCRVNQNFDISWILDLGLTINVLRKYIKINKIFPMKFSFFNAEKILFLLHGQVFVMFWFLIF